MVQLSGTISTGSRLSVDRLNDAGVSGVLEKAFKKGKPSAVALVINSPGGSPVQSSLIAARIQRLSKENKVPVYAFVEDLAASGGYWLATAADEIYVDPASIVGSIGVIHASFGFDKFIEKHGIKRRVHTAGESKSMLDPFRPEKPADVKRHKVLLEQVHQVFKARVIERRGAKLTREDLFTGDIWIGEKAVEIGLADGIGHVIPKMKEILGDKTRFVTHGKRRGIFQRIGSQIADDAIGVVEDRALWAHYGM